MTKAKAILVAASLIMFAGTAAEAKNKPTETETGNLDFKGVSDRELNEFIAENLHIMNRRIASLDFQLLNAALKMRFMTPEQYRAFAETGLLQSQSALRTINPSTSELPGGQKDLDQFLNNKPLTPRQ